MDFDRQVLRALSKRRRTVPDIRVPPRPKPSIFHLRKADKYDYVKHRLVSMRPYFLEVVGVESFEPVNTVSGVSFHTYGIVMNPFGLKLDASNIFIASNIDGSNDVAVRLSMEHLKRYSVFPGQVVAVKGKNTTGSEIVVEALHCIPVVDVNAGRGEGEQPSVEVFAGPYGAEGDASALDKVLESDADVLILVGPFVGAVEDASRSPDCVMQDVFIPKVRSWLGKSTNSKVVLVPSTDDMGGLNVFPQAPLCIEDERIVCVGNPCELFVNGHLVAISSLDTALEISSEECFLDSGEGYDEDACGRLLFGGDRLGRIAYHLVFQRTFLPVFPSRNVVSYAVPEGMSMDIAPDIYVVVSRLKRFVRDAGPCVVVNLGTQSREGGGAGCTIGLPGRDGGRVVVEFVRGDG